MLYDEAVDGNCDTPDGECGKRPLEPDTLNEDAAKTLEKVEVMLMARKLKLEMVFAGIEADAKGKIGADLQPPELKRATKAAKAFRHLKRRYMVRKEQLAALESQVAASKVTREALSSEELYDLYADVLHFPTEIETEVKWLPQKSESDDGKIVDAESSSEALELEDGTVQAHTNVTTEKDGEEEEHLFGLEYQGKDAQRRTWVQFFWREVIYGYEYNGSPVVESPPLHLTDTLDTGLEGIGHRVVPAPGGTFESQGKPSQAHWELDFTSLHSPSYEEKGQAGFDEQRLAMFDSPSSLSQLYEGLIRGAPPGHKSPRVMTRWHAESYLMALDAKTGMVKPEARVRVDIEWDPRSDQKQTVRITGPVAVTRLPGALRGTLNEENETLIGNLSLPQGEMIQ